MKAAYLALCLQLPLKTVGYGLPLLLTLCFVFYMSERTHKVEGGLVFKYTVCAKHTLSEIQDKLT